MPVSGSPDNLYIGRSNYPAKITNVVQLLADAREEHFDYVQLPLGVSTQKGDYVFEPSVRSDLVVDSKTWSSAVLGEVSPWIDPDGANPERSLEALAREIQWSSHLSVLGAMLPKPNPKGCARYANYVNRVIQTQTVNNALILHIPMMYSENEDGWNTWNTFRMMCEQSQQLFVALELTKQTTEVPDRWNAEPIRYIIIPTSVFVPNNHGYPVLSMAHQRFLKTMFAKFKCQVILRTDEGIIESPIMHDGCEEKDPNPCTMISAHVNYIGRLFMTKKPLDEAEVFGLSYRDFLQSPLQPLQDNLESRTYETFEQDPVKYVQYEEAVLRCIEDKLEEKGKSTKLVIMVVGAGRGPLVVACLDAAERAGLVHFEIWAVEKNPNAVITLRHRKFDEPNWEPVTIIHQDMREWDAPTKADIMVSELLGSFSDNELSPECLDGAQRFLAPDGVSIPQHYYSTLRLVSTPKLWTELRKGGEGDLDKFETAYVVKFHQHWCCSSARKVFSFSHPNWELTSNERYTNMRFTVEADALVHGFSAYFHCDLYKDVHISIEPASESVGMFSWFPAYFPLRQTVFLKKGEEVVVDFWRCEDKHKVWYEWAVPSHYLPIHNPGGRSYFIGK